MNRERALQQLGKQVREELNEMADPAVLSNVRSRLVGDVGGGREAPKGRWGRRVGAGATVLALAAAVLLWWRTAGPDDVAFQVGTAASPGEVGQWIAAREDEPLELRFDDHTQLELAPKARLRVAESTEERIWLIVESGIVEATIVAEGKTSRHQVDFGPFEVHALSGRWKAHYTPDSGTFRVEMLQGEALIESPATPDGIRIRAGQSVSVDEAGSRLEIEQSAAPQGAPSGSAPPAP